MKLLKNIIISVVALVIVAAAGGFLLPREVVVSRQVAINAPPDRVFEYVNDLKKFNEWSPWEQKDPGMKQTYSGPDSGVGQKVAWESTNKDVGSGTQEIIESVPGKHVKTALNFGDMGTANATFDLEGFDGGTKITWGFRTDVGNNPLMRWMGLMFDSWVGKEYEKGLASLKELAEKPAAG